MVRSASEEKDPEQRKAKLTFLMAGGGYTGVEGIAALNELVREAIAQFPSLRDPPVQVILAEPMDRLMSEVTPDLAAYSQKQLKKAGVRVLLNMGIKGVENGVVELSNGEQIRASTFIWAAGVQPNPLISQLGAATGKSKGLKVNNCLAVGEMDEVWAVGDCAEVPQPDGTAPTDCWRRMLCEKESGCAKYSSHGARRGAEAVHVHAHRRTRPCRQAQGRGTSLRSEFFGCYGVPAVARRLHQKMPSLAQRLRVLGDWCLDVFLGPAAEYQLSSSNMQLNQRPAQR